MLEWCCSGLCELDPRGRSQKFPLWGRNELKIAFKIPQNNCCGRTMFPQQHADMKLQIEHNQKPENYLLVHLNSFILHSRRAVIDSVKTGQFTFVAKRLRQQRVQLLNITVCHGVGATRTTCTKTIVYHSSCQLLFHSTAQNKDKRPNTNSVCWTGSHWDESIRH